MYETKIIGIMSVSSVTMRPKSTESAAAHPYGETNDQTQPHERDLEPTKQLYGLQVKLRRQKHVLIFSKEIFYAEDATLCL